MPGVASPKDAPKVIERLQEHRCIGHTVREIKKRHSLIQFRICSVRNDEHVLEDGRRVREDASVHAEEDVARANDDVAAVEEEIFAAYALVDVDSHPELEHSQGCDNSNWSRRTDKESRQERTKHVQTNPGYTLNTDGLIGQAGIGRGTSEA
jgi:hypothetical protein